MVSEKMRKEFSFFNSLSSSDLSLFLGFCENRQMPAGDTLWIEGNRDNYAAFILSGLIGIKKKTEFEGKYVVVGTYGRGSVIGELCLLTDHVRSVTAEVLEPADLVFLTSANFERLIREYPVVGFKLLKKIFLTTCQRLNRSYDRIASIF